MPGRDGTGPWGYEPRTGRGLGYCAGGYPLYGFGCRWGGHGRGFRRFATPGALKPTREMLEAERQALRQRLEFIEKQLEDDSADEAV